jgi:hypothetical protein
VLSEMLAEYQETLENPDTRADHGLCELLLTRQQRFGLHHALSDLPDYDSVYKFLDQRYKASKGACVTPTKQKASVSDLPRMMSDEHLQTTLLAHSSSAPRAEHPRNHRRAAICADEGIE